MADPGHPRPSRLRGQLRRAKRMVDEIAEAEKSRQYPYHRGYWEGCLATYRIAAVDLGYSHEEIDSWLTQE